MGSASESANAELYRADGERSRDDLAGLDWRSDGRHERLLQLRRGDVVECFQRQDAIPLLLDHDDAFVRLKALAAGAVEAPLARIACSPCLCFGAFIGET